MAQTTRWKQRYLTSMLFKVFKKKEIRIHHYLGDGYFIILELPIMNLSTQSHHYRVCTSHFHFIGLGIWAFPISQIFQSSIARSTQTHNSVDITDLEQLVLNIVNPVQKELEERQNNASILFGKV